jgi:hypothetical protein
MKTLLKKLFSKTPSRPRTQTKSERTLESKWLDECKTSDSLAIKVWQLKEEIARLKDAGNSMTKYLKETNQPSEVYLCWENATGQSNYLDKKQNVVVR